MDDRTLFGRPGAEQLYFEAVEVWESELDGCGDEPPDGGWEIEEWTVRPPRSHMPSADWVIERLLEHIAEAEVDEYAYDAWDNASREAEVEAMLEAWASRVTYRMAHNLIATHRITMVGDDPYLDGEPMYVPVKPGPGQTDIFGGEVS